MSKNREREIQSLGGKPNPNQDDRQVVEEAFATYRERGELPPQLRAVLSRLSREDEEEPTGPDDNHESVEKESDPHQD